MANFKNFIGQSYTLQNRQFDCQRTVNWYPEVDETGNGKNNEIAHFVDREGLVLAIEADLGFGAVRGLYVTSFNSAFAAVGSSLFQINGSRPPFSVTLVGTLQTNRGIVRFADNGRYVCLVDGNNGYTYDLTGTDGFSLLNDQPAWLGATHVDCLDEYFIFGGGRTGENGNVFFWSNQNSTQLNGLSFARKNGAPDPIAGLVVVNRALWLIGTQTTEVWTNNPSPTGEVVPQI